MIILPIEHNLYLTSAMLEEMEGYLHSGEVFWPLERRAARGAPPFPRLTLGTLLLTLDQLEAVRDEMTASQAADYQRLRMQMDMLQNKHVVALEGKAGREAQARLNLWRATIIDLEESPGRAGSYAYEVRHRVMLARLPELAPRGTELHAAIDAAQAIDRRLRPLFVQDAFVWDERLQGAYAQDPYWYLYGHPRRQE
jgi:hypothetical protein